MRKGLSCHLAVLLALFLALYGRSVGWGWLSLDDRWLLQHNEYLGQGWRSIWWGLLDVEYGRRWTPVLWVLAEVFTGGGVVGYHVGALLVGFGLVVAVYFAADDVAGENWALPVAALFCASPLRLEIFAWCVGWIYSAVALFLTLAFLAENRGRRSLALLFCVLGLLVYPQAAGACLLAVWCWRREWQGWALLAFIGVLFAVQATLRVNIGFSSFEPTLQGALWVFPHYFGALFVPLATTPITPAGFYWLLVIPVGMLAFLASWSVRPIVILGAILAPTVLASVTEPFWYAARYSTLFSIGALLLLGYWLAVHEGLVRRVFVWALVGTFALSTVTNEGYRAIWPMIDRADAESVFLYGVPSTPGPRLKEIAGERP